MIVPNNYNSKLSFLETEEAIKFIKDNFQKQLSKNLNLTRISAPLFVFKNNGFNDNLNNVETPVGFRAKNIKDDDIEVVHSLAKWKRMALAYYNFNVGGGIYCDMNAIRADEETSNIHSLYVDQWDWEKIIEEKDRNLDKLRSIVKSLYLAFKDVEEMVISKYPKLGKSYLPKDIKFIHSQELLDRYPDSSPKERENKIVDEYGSVFVIGIGNKLSDGEPHDLRAPDYDDWTTKNEDGYNGINGDIIFKYPVLDMAYELSSMGIRVDKEAMLKQLDITNTNERKNLYWHKKLLNNELPYTIGGGIGQSRLCLFMLRKVHIGEVQASVWPKETIDICKDNNINLL